MHPQVKKTREQQNEIIAFKKLCRFINEESAYVIMNQQIILNLVSSVFFSVTVVPQLPRAHCLFFFWFEKHQLQTVKL